MTGTSGGRTRMCPPSRVGVHTPSHPEAKAPRCGTRSCEAGANGRSQDPSAVSPARPAAAYYGRTATSAGTSAPVMRVVTSVPLRLASMIVPLLSPEFPGMVQ
jgi:hypothetical protein